MPKLTSTSFVRWTTTYFLGWMVGQAIFIVFAALALDRSIQSLGLPYLLLAWCGYVGGVLIYWARRPYGRPNSGPIRFAVAIFLFLNLYMGALVFSAYSIHLLSRSSSLYDYGPYILPVSALASIVIYLMAHGRL